MRSHPIAADDLNIAMFSIDCDLDRQSEQIEVETAQSVVGDRSMQRTALSFPNQYPD